MPWFGANGDARESMTGQTLLTSWKPGNKEKGKTQYPSVPFRMCTSDVTSNQQVPHPEDSTTFQKHTSWWLTLQCMALYIYVCMCLFILWLPYPWLDGICKWSYDSWMCGWLILAGGFFPATIVPTAPKNCGLYFQISSTRFWTFSFSEVHLCH